MRARDPVRTMFFSPDLAGTVEEYGKGKFYCCKGSNNGLTGWCNPVRQSPIHDVQTPLSRRRSAFFALRKFEPKVFKGCLLEDVRTVGAVVCWSRSQGLLTGTGVLPVLPDGRERVRASCPGSEQLCSDKSTPAPASSTGSNGASWERLFPRRRSGAEIVCVDEFGQESP